jgi:hypothetical protein
VVVYGSSMTILLYLKCTNSDYRERGVVRVLTGILSADRGFHGRRIFGVEVLGGLEQLHRLVTAGKVDRIVVTDECSDEERRFLSSFVLVNGLSFSEWRFAEQAPRSADAEPQRLVR